VAVQQQTTHAFLAERVDGEGEGDDYIPDMQGALSSERVWREEDYGN
jgi:hypothetical protein